MDTKGLAKLMEALDQVQGFDRTALHSRMNRVARRYNGSSNVPSRLTSFA